MPDPSVPLPDVAVEVDFASTSANALVLDSPTRGLLDTAELGEPLAFVDVSADIRRMRVDRGTTQFDGIYARANASSASILLDNRAAAYDPTNEASPYWDAAAARSLVRPRRRVRVRGPQFAQDAFDAGALVGAGSGLDLEVDMATAGYSPTSGTLSFRLRMTVGDWSSSYLIPVDWQASGSGVLFDIVEGAIGISVIDSPTWGAGVGSGPTAFDDVPNGVPVWLRLDVEPDTGGADDGAATVFYALDNAGNPGTWTQIFTQALQSNGNMNGVVPDAGNGLLSIGGPFGTGEFTIHAVQVIDGGGTIATVNLGNVVAVDPTATDVEVLDSNGTAWLIASGSQIVAGGGRPGIWSGFARAWNPTFPAGNDNESIVALECVDAISILSGFESTAGATQGADEFTGERIERIIDNADFPDDQRDIATGLTACQATTLEGNAWALCLLTADTEIGELYVDGDGRLVFRDRHSIYTAARSATSQAVFGDDQTTEGTTEIPYKELAVQFDDEQIRNEVTIQRVGGTAVTVADDASKALYQPKSFSRTDLIHTTDAESSNYANYIVGQFAEPQLRFQTLVVDARRSEAAQLQCLTREIGDRITIRIRPVGRADVPLERECIIRGISHDVDYQAKTWRTSFTLQQADTFAPFRLNSSELDSETERIAF